MLEWVGGATEIQGRADGVFAEGERRTNRTDGLNLRVELRT